MTVKIKVVRASLLEHPVRNIILIALVGTLLLGLVVCESIFGYYYFQYRHIVDERLQKPLFEQTAKIYAAPKELRVGQKLTPQTVAQELRAAGYSGDDDRERSRHFHARNLEISAAGLPIHIGGVLRGSPSIAGRIRGAEAPWHRTIRRCGTLVGPCDTPRKSELFT